MLGNLFALSAPGPLLRSTISSSSSSSKKKAQRLRKERIQELILNYDYPPLPSHNSSSPKANHLLSMKSSISTTNSKSFQPATTNSIINSNIQMNLVSPSQQNHELLKRPKRPQSSGPVTKRKGKQSLSAKQKDRERENGWPSVHDSYLPKKQIIRFKMKLLGEVTQPIQKGNSLSKKSISQEKKKEQSEIQDTQLPLSVSLNIQKSTTSSMNVKEEPQEDMLKTPIRDKIDLGLKSASQVNNSSSTLNVQTTETRGRSFTEELRILNAEENANNKDNNNSNNLVKLQSKVHVQRQRTYSIPQRKVELTSSPLQLSLVEAAEKINSNPQDKKFAFSDKLVQEQLEDTKYTWSNNLDRLKKKLSFPRPEFIPLGTKYSFSGGNQDNQYFKKSPKSTKIANFKTRHFAEGSPQLNPQLRQDVSKKFEQIPAKKEDNNDTDNIGMRFYNRRTNSVDYSSPKFHSFPWRISEMIQTKQNIDRRNNSSNFKSKQSETSNKKPKGIDLQWTTLMKNLDLSSHLEELTEMVAKHKQIFNGSAKDWQYETKGEGQMNVNNDFNGNYYNSNNISPLVSLRENISLY